MNTRLVKIENDPQAFLEAGEILRAGGLVAFPTETVYGLGGNALDSFAAKKIYAAKGRPSDNPLIVHVAEMESLYELASEVPRTAKMLSERFWPGPLTMILPKKASVPDGTTGGLKTVAVRMPDHPAALQLIRTSGVYLAAPSANTSGRPSPTCAEHVMEDLNGKIEMVLDGGTVGIGIESTIVDLTGEIPVILRPGNITKRMLEEVVGEVAIDPAVLTRHPDPELRPKAPGMKYKHYAPKAELVILEGEPKRVIDRINQETKKAQEKGKKVGIIATTQTQQFYDADVIRVIGSREEEETIARGLYASLREFDKDQVDLILSESFSDGIWGQAVMNRLLKAAGYQVITV